MKKLFVTLIILVISILCVGCGEQTSELDMVKDNISYMEISKYIGANEMFSIEVTTIDGEEILMCDGIVGSKKKRTQIKLIPTNLSGTVGEVKLVLKNKDKSVETNLTKDVLGLSFSAILDDAMCDFNVSEVDITLGEENSNIALHNVLGEDNYIDATKALEISYETLKDKIGDYFENGKFRGETVIKLIHSKKVTDSPYYYYIMIVNDKEKYASCLVNPFDGKVVNYKVK